MSSLSHPNLRYRVPRSVIEETICFLRERGQSRGHEGVVLWAARLDGLTCQVEPHPVLPAQITTRRSYRIPTEESFRIIRYLHANELVIPIQVHSHPREAFHSEADDELAFVQHRNAISIVVPDFAQWAPAEFPSRASFYYLHAGTEWIEMSAQEVQSRFVFHE